MEENALIALAAIGLIGIGCQWLVTEPELSGVLIVGANIVCRAIARALNEQGFFSQVADTDGERRVCRD